MTNFKGVGLLGLKGVGYISLRTTVLDNSDSLVMPSVQIEEAPPALRGAVQHREDPHECGELAGGRRAPLLDHQV